MSQPKTDRTPAIARWELLLLSAIFAVGILLRLLNFSDTTVEHFDEGVYASNLWFGPEDSYQYPQRHLYAPPLLPWFIKWTMVFAGRITGLLAVIPSAAAGCGTILTIWWLARKSFGPAAALIAASFCSASGLHILLSRSALTDSCLLLWFVLALIWFTRAWKTASWWDFLAAGMFTSLAWWTKYNGWLPLMVSAGALAACLLLQRNLNHAWRESRGWLIAAFTAFIGWSPYLASLQSRGGYSAVAANHSQYVVGISGWWSSLSRQLGNVMYLGSWPNVDLVSLSLGVVGGVTIASHLWRNRTETKLPDGPLLVWVWFVLLGLMTPLYTPYPRLLLPLLASSWLLSGAAVDRAVSRLWDSVRQNSDASPPVSAAKWRAILVSAVISLLAFISWTVGPVWAKRTGIEAVARQIQHDIQVQPSVPSQNQYSAIYIYGEPALFFQLRAAGVPFAAAIQTLDLKPATDNGIPIVTFLAVGPHARRDPKFKETWHTMADRYRLVGEYSAEWSPLVLLDNYSANELWRDKPTDAIQLYRIR